MATEKKFIEFLFKIPDSVLCTLRPGVLFGFLVMMRGASWRRKIEKIPENFHYVEFARQGFNVNMEEMALLAEHGTTCAAGFQLIGPIMYDIERLERWCAYLQKLHVAYPPKILKEYFRRCKSVGYLMNPMGNITVGNDGGWLTFPAILAGSLPKPVKACIQAKLRCQMGEEFQIQFEADPIRNTVWLLRSCQTEVDADLGKGWFASGQFSTSQWAGVTVINKGGWVRASKEDWFDADVVFQNSH